MVKILKDDSGKQFKAYERGYYVGFKATIEGQKDIKFFLHNHLRFNILYNRDSATDLSRIVGFEVEAFSVNHQFEKPWDPKNPVLQTCNPNRMVAVSHTQPPQAVEPGAEVIFTYDVKFTVSWHQQLLDSCSTA